MRISSNNGLARMIDRKHVQISEEVMPIDITLRASTRTV